MKSAIRPWTYEERVILKKNYFVVPLIELQKQLPGRTESSIYSQVYYLKKRGWRFKQRSLREFE